jgi:predicted secreted protein
MVCREKTFISVTVSVILLIAMGISQADITVCPDGCDYKSIQFAIKDAMLEDTIKVYGLDSDQGLLVNKELTLRGLIYEGKRPVLAADNDSVAVLSADGITLKGFDFITPQASARDNDKGKDCSTLIVNSEGNRIYLNDFTGSNGICSKGSNFWNSTENINYQYNGQVFRGNMGNYWSDYSGLDKNLDGIGDEPKVIDANNTDYHPLMDRSESYMIAGEKLEETNTIQARLNQPFNITLESNPTTGYSWTVDFDSHFLTQENEGYVRSRPGLVGSGGQQIFTFTPIRIGKTTISAVYKRPWENIVADEKTFSIIIT